MTTCLARFAMRVSRGPGCCSAVKLKCIIPIPIGTTPDTNIVQMIRDRMRVSFAAGDTPLQISSLQVSDRTKEYKLLKSLTDSELLVASKVQRQSPGLVSRLYYN